MSNSEYITEKRYFPSSDKGKKIYYEIYTKKDFQPKAVIQLVHGMCEYVRRYREFARFLNDNGYLVVGNDHLGHGMTAAKLAEEKDGIIDPNKNKELGFISERNGWQHCLADMHRLTRVMKKEYPDLPYFMFAHSMGSLLGRAYATSYPDELDGVIFSGTGALLGVEPQLMLYLQGIRKVKGSRFRPPLTDMAMFGKYGIYNSKSGRDGGNWLNRNEDEVIKYNADAYCNFCFTVNGFENLVGVNYYVNRNKWFEEYPKELPTYIISGSKDPVGDCGRGVLKVYNKLRLYDCDAEMKIYNGARHELINELNKEEVYRDVLDFYEGIMSAKTEGEG
ncbi:alpha/beta fold hydrolase [Ruminococcus albus]|uniref:alpha/beta fold hydrolase n=1 Tax=Ruminococcus albus TaxID=1264 RepID=UPI00046335B6|nr:alpha/beta fold hydrolase [Ruminococcus albus]